MRAVQRLLAILACLLLLASGCTTSSEDEGNAAKPAAESAAGQQPNASQPQTVGIRNRAAGGETTASPKTDGQAMPANNARIPVGVQALSDAAFAEAVLKSPVPVVVDFYADWCGPCKIIAPYFERLAKKYEGRVAFGKLNTDYNRRTAAAYQITGLPTVLVFKDGKVVARLRGLQSQQAYEAAINGHL